MVCTPDVMTLAPETVVMLPTVSELKLFARPLKVSVPPLIVIGAASLTRLALSISRPALLSISSVPKFSTIAEVPISVPLVFS